MRSHTLDEIKTAVFCFVFLGKVELHGKVLEVEHSVPKRQRYVQILLYRAWFNSWEQSVLFLLRHFPLRRLLFFKC